MFSTTFPDYDQNSQHVANWTVFDDEQRDDTSKKIVRVSWKKKKITETKIFFSRKLDKYFVGGRGEYLRLQSSKNPLSIHDYSTNPIKLNTRAKAIPTTNFIPPFPPILDEPLVEVPAVEELVDVDVAPDPEPDAEVDELELEVEKVAIGIWVMVVQVPPIKIYEHCQVKPNSGCLTARRSVLVIRQERYLAACSQLNQSSYRSTVCSEWILYRRASKRLGSVWLIYKQIC